MNPRAVELGRNVDDEEEDLIELSPGELEGVDAIFGWVEKTARVFQIYPENNKIFIDFTEGLTQSFIDFLRQHGELDLVVEENRFLYAGRTVYDEPNRAKSLSMRLFRDGIRKIVFYEGLTKREVLDFLDALTRPVSTGDLDDDIVTLLWSKDFEHFSYYVLDDSAVAGGETGVEADLSGAVKRSGEEGTLGAAPSKGEASSTAETIEDTGVEEEEETEPGTKLKLPKVPPADLSSVLTITEHDLDLVRKMIARENARNLRHDLTTMLFEMLNLRDTKESFQNSISVLGQLIRSYVATGNLREAVEVVRKFRELAESDLREELMTIVVAEIETAGSAESMKEIGRLFEQPIMQNVKEVTAFLTLLGAPVLPHLISVLPRARGGSQALTAIIAEVGRRSPGALIERLNETDPTIVKILVGILGGFEDPALAAHLVPHLTHPIVAVRLEAVRALSTLGGPAARTGLLEVLEDPEYQVRIHALRCLEERDDSAVIRNLELVMDRKDFPSRNIHEKQEFFRTMAVLGGESAIPFLSKHLDRGSWLNRSKDENRICAATALGLLASPRTVRILERSLRGARGPLKDACEVALVRVRAEVGEPKGGEES